jgi:hypothetical protein
VTVCATINRGSTCAASKRLRKRGALCPMRAPVGDVCERFVSSQERREMERERRESRQRVATLLAMTGMLGR